jgi:hypothetical protein
MLVDTSRQGHLVLGLGTSGSGQGDLCQISLDTQNTSSNLRCSDVDKELLSCGQLLNLYLCENMVVDSVFESVWNGLLGLTYLRLLLVRSLYSQQSSQQEDYFLDSSAHVI